MRRALKILLVAAFGVYGLAVGSGCVDDATVTCTHLDNFIAECADPTCGVTWDCEDMYDTYDYETQLDLDACADCLQANLDEGTCADCTAPDRGIGSCINFLSDLLGVACW